MEPHAPVGPIADITCNSQRRAALHRAAGLRHGSLLRPCDRNLRAETKVPTAVSGSEQRNGAARMSEVRCFDGASYRTAGPQRERPVPGFHGIPRWRLNMAVRSAFRKRKSHIDANISTRQ